MLTLWSVGQPTLTANSNLQQKHIWLHGWTHSKYALLALPFHASVLCWFSTWNVFRIFSLNGLDPGLGRCREAIEPAEYHLHLGYVTCLFTFTPMLGFLWIVAVSMSVALGTQWFSGIRWVDQKAVCIWESRAMMSHRGRSPDNLHCGSCAKAWKVVHLTSHVLRSLMDAFSTLRWSVGSCSCQVLVPNRPLHELSEWRGRSGTRCCSLSWALGPG